MQNLAATSSRSVIILALVGIVALSPLECLATDLFSTTTVSTAEAGAADGFEITVTQKGQTRDLAYLIHDTLKTAVRNLCSRVWGAVQEFDYNETEELLELAAPKYFYRVRQSFTCQRLNNVPIYHPTVPCPGANVVIPEIDHPSVVSNTAVVNHGSIKLFGFIRSTEDIAAVKLRLGDACSNELIPDNPAAEIKRTLSILSERVGINPVFNPIHQTKTPRDNSYVAYLCCERIGPRSPDGRGL